jgi:DNA-binding phage protein
MVVTDALLEAVKENGMTLNGVAKKMGMSYMSLYRKSRNVSPFRISEVEMLCKVLGLSTKAKREKIFLP